MTENAAVDIHASTIGYAADRARACQPAGPAALRRLRLRAHSFQPAPQSQSHGPWSWAPAI